MPRGLAGLALAELVDGDDPEAVDAVRVEAQLQVVEVSGHFLPLLPLPLPLLCVLLLPGLHNEPWRDTVTLTQLPAKLRGMCHCVQQHPYILSTQPNLYQTTADIITVSGSFIGSPDGL